MSGHETASARRSNKQDAMSATAHTAPPAASATATVPPSVTIEIAGLNVTLPLKFLPGHVLTENQAKILDAAYQRQFTNNQNANAKARAERLAKATTDAERAANAPQSATDIAAAYIDYEPAVGGGTRGNSLETLRHAMAWRFWTTLVADHNKSVSAGGPALITKAGAKQVTITAAPRKGKDQTEEAFKIIRDKFDNDRTAFKLALLDHSAYGPRIAALVEAEITARRAEQAVNKTDSADVAVADEDLL